MDLVAFTDFVLAWDHRSHPAAIKYFFPIFDLNQRVRWCAPRVCDQTAVPVSMSAAACSSRSAWQAPAWLASAGARAHG